MAEQREIDSYEETEKDKLDDGEIGDLLGTMWEDFQRDKQLLNIGKDESKKDDVNEKLVQYLN